MSMELNNLACVLVDDFFLLCRAFSDSMLSSFSFFKELLSCPCGWVSWSESLNQNFWEICASSSAARLEEQYSFKATWVFFSCSLGTPSTVLRMGFENWAALKTKMGETLYSFIGPSLLWSLILHTSKWECHELVDQQTLSQSHDCYGLDFQVLSCSTFIGSCCQVFCWRYW